MIRSRHAIFYAGLLALSVMLGLLLGCGGAGLGESGGLPRATPTASPTPRATPTPSNVPPPPPF